MHGCINKSKEPSPLLHLLQTLEEQRQTISILHLVQRNTLSLQTSVPAKRMQDTHLQVAVLLGELLLDHPLPPQEGDLVMDAQDRSL